MFASHFVHLERLKLKNHSEAYLKIGELLVADLNINTKETDHILRGAGYNFVKAMLCPKPMVKYDYYKRFGFEKLEELRQLTSTGKYTDQHSNMIHFYHALGLLILDKDEFTKTNESLFKGKDQSLTAPYALELCKNQKLLLSDFVKCRLLKSLVELESGITPQVLAQVKRLLTSISQEIPSTPTIAVIDNADLDRNLTTFLLKCAPYEAAVYRNIGNTYSLYLKEKRMPRICVRDGRKRMFLQVGC